MVQRKHNLKLDSRRVTFYWFGSHLVSWENLDVKIFVGKLNCCFDFVLSSCRIRLVNVLGICRLYGFYGSWGYGKKS